MMTPRTCVPCSVLVVDRLHTTSGAIRVALKPLRVKPRIGKTALARATHQNGSSIVHERKHLGAFTINTILHFFKYVFLFVASERFEQECSGMQNEAF